jgi:hypothetical protein
MKGRKRLVLALILIVLAMPALAEGIDLVVMVDTSASMFPVFDDLVNYLLRDILENRLRTGDTFHLLSFAGSAEEELSLKIEETSDLEAVIGRILLLQPLGRYTDLIGALEYLYGYLSELPPENRKLVLLLTDGIHDPPPGSPNRVGAAEALERLLANTERIRRAGWEVRIFRTPGEEEQAEAALRSGAEAAEAAAGGERGAEAAGPSGPAAEAPSEQRGGPAAAAGEAAAAGGTADSGGQDMLGEIAEALDTDIVELDESGFSDAGTLSGRLTGFATVRFPDDLGEVRRRVTAPFTVTNNASDPLSLTLSAVLHDGRNLLLSPVRREIEPGAAGSLEAALRLPPGLPRGPQRLAVRLQFSDPELRISPLQGELIFTYAPSFAVFEWLSGIPRLYLLYALAAVVLAALVVLLILLLRNRLADASFAGFYGAGKRGAKRGRPIIMRVREQNSQIGSRNIHRVPAKKSLSVGGDGSAYLIYFVRVPRRIGVLTNDGRRFVFTPKKPDYFVELEEPLPDCLGKEIRATSSRGYPIVFSFHEYVSPLEELNRLLRSIHHEGAYPPKEPAAGE